MTFSQAALAGLTLTLGLMVACDDSPTATPRLIPTPTASPTSTPVPVDFVVLQPRSVTLEVGEAQRFTGMAYDRFENPVPEAGIDRLGSLWPVFP